MADEKPVETSLPITVMQRTLITDADAAATRAKERLELVVSGVLAAHSIQSAAIVRLDKDGAQDVLVVKLPEDKG